ncbi:hypothetical protein HYH02_011691 [Chlamydomonas schloesseri]|uniref:Plant heme peroxidase family profile domain-containing protein n=1 Tax=Chlamydomonas schloesseri TaxID=2026947 RepID=A0A835T4N0_9CHLO|nr:hypothetical protein HYH02_011691 [Chlamydomonas schloesseri]|eukprot:KAG2435978.1 hypothetical protein HYH02_011691 [Chlamydomonas schloesseri]
MAVNVTACPGPDCGGADSSLLLSPEELARPESSNDDFAALTARAAKKIASFFDISVADTLAVCAAVAPEVLSNGRIKILNGNGRGLRVGRLDCSTMPAPPNQLPSAAADLDTFIKFWADRGINETEAVALMGSHSLVDSQGCFAGGKPNNYCDPATQNCTDVRMFRWENHYYRDICSPTIKVTAVDPVRDPPEPADTPVLAMSEPELDAEARLETCKFTSKEGRVMALNRLKQWQTGAAREPEAVREPLAVSWSKKFCRAGEQWGVTPSNCPHSNDWWYTPNDALIGQACQDESPIGITGANAGHSKIRDAARLFLTQSNWDAMYRVAYIKMVEAFANWSLKAPFFVNGGECASGIHLQAACAFKPSPPATAAASNESMAVVKDLYDGLYQPLSDRSLLLGACKACALGVCPQGNVRCPLCINHFNNYMATNKKSPVNLDANACCGCATIMREYRYVPPASGTGTGTIISIPFASRFGALLEPTQQAPQPLSPATVPPVPERLYEPDPGNDAVAESVLVAGSFSNPPLSPYSDPSTVCPAADGTSVNVRGFPSSPFKWTPFEGSNGKPANAFSWPPRAQRAHTYHKPGTNLTIDTFEIDIKVIKKDLGCPNGPTELLSYNGSVPGPTFRIRKGHQTLVRYNNLMTTDHLRGTRFEPFHPCDGKMVPTESGPVLAGRGISVHLHGEASLAPYDGWAEDTTCGGETKDYYYSNRRTGFAWYHDHQLDITSENAYFGLAGMYVVTDSKYEEGCGEPWNLDELPDVPMILKDMVFDDKCQLLYNHNGPHRNNLYGDVNTVNNTWEVWCLETGGGWFHPIHIHLVDFYVLARNWDESLVHEYERWTAKDVVQLNPSGHVALLLRFGPHRGEYMFHCHNLVHEDFEMMRSYSVDHTAGSKTASTALPMQNLEPTLLTTQNVIYDLYNDPVYPNWAAKPSVGLTRLWDLTTPAAAAETMKATTYPLDAGIYRLFYPGGGPANEDPRLRDPNINPWPPSPAPPTPNIAACPVNPVCNTNAVLNGAGILTGKCSSCAVRACVKEGFVGEFSSPRYAHNDFLNLYGCIAKPSGTVEVTVPNTLTTTVPVYPPIKTSTYSTLDAFFSANPATGTGVGMACYTDTTYNRIAFYLYIQKENTPSDNYACPTCKYYSVNQVSSCWCDDENAWAIPIASVMESLPASSTAEQILTSGYPGGAQVFWNPRTVDNDRKAWGGFFRILPAASGNHDTSIEYTFDICAGCGQNRVGNGFIFGRIKFQITHIKGSTSISTFLAPADAPNAIGRSSELHMFQSFRAPMSLSPSQFETYTVTSAVPDTFSYGQTWTVNKVNTGKFKANGDEITVPPYDPTKGLYVALHLKVSSGGFCAFKLPAPVQP